MSVKLLFNDLPTFLDSSGNPATGYKLHFFAAGSTTYQNVYQDSGGLSQHSNPITLNARGQPAAAVWGTVGLTYKMILASPTDTSPPVTAIETVDNISGINDATVTIDEWVASGNTPTYISATSFSVTGDQTSAYHKGRRLKTTNSGGTAYSTVVSSAFGALTTVTVVNDAGGNTLDAGLSSVNLSIVKADNPSINSDMVSRKATAVNSAATTDIWSIAGDYVHIAGTTGISSFSTAPYAGARRKIIHDGALTLTHGTNLKCPGDQDLAVAANTVYEVIADTTTAHRVVGVTHAFSRPAQFPRMYVSGLTYSNNVGDATNDLDIAVGDCRDSTNAMDMVLGAALTKQLDAAWAVGTNQGGLDTGAIGNSDYYIWIIKRSDTGVVDALYSLSSTAPTMPANYDYKRLIGWFKRVGGTIVAFHTYEIEGGGIELSWDVPTLDINLANTLTTARRTDPVKVPLNFSVIAHLNALMYDASVAGQGWLYNPDHTDAAPSASAAPLANFDWTTAKSDQKELWIRTSSTGTVAARGTVATVDTYFAATMGFRWTRRN